MQTIPGKGEAKWGWAPALLFVFVTFSLGWASAGMIADILGMGWIVWPLRIGFLVSEAMVIAWLFEPQKGYYTEEQVAAMDIAKQAILGAGLIDGVLMIIIRKFGGGEALVALQSIVTLGAIFVAAGASMHVISKDPNRISRVKETTANVAIFLEDVKLKFQAHMDVIETKRMELAANERARRDLKRFTMEALNGPECQRALEAAGVQLASGIVRRYSERVQSIAGLVTTPSSAPVGELGGVSAAPQKRRMFTRSIPFTVSPSSGDGAPGR